MPRQVFSTKIFRQTHKVCKTNRRTPNSGVRYKQPPYNMGRQKNKTKEEKFYWNTSAIVACHGLTKALIQLSSIQEVTTL